MCSHEIFLSFPVLLIDNWIILCHHPVGWWLMQDTWSLDSCWMLPANPVTTLLWTRGLEFTLAGETQNSFSREGWRLPGCAIWGEVGDSVVAWLLPGQTLPRGDTHGKPAELFCAYSREFWDAEQGTWPDSQRQRSQDEGTTSSPPSRGRLLRFGFSLPGLAAVGSEDPVVTPG